MVKSETTSNKAYIMISIWDLSAWSTLWELTDLE